MNFANHVDTRARTMPDRLAAADPRRRLTYGELRNETDAVAGGLAELGVDPGDRVALFLPNSVSFVTAYLGAMKRGAIPVPINLRYESDAMQHVFDDAAPAAVFTVGELASRLAELEPNVEHVIAADSTYGLDYGAFVAGSDGIDRPYPRRDTETAEILYTSGTTGLPKGVEHTHGNLTANAFATIHYMRPDRDGSYLTVVPCFHAAGLNTTTTPALVHGVPVHFLLEWDPETALRTLEAHGITYTMFIPTMLHDLLEHGVEEYDLSALEWFGVGGAPMPVERFDEAENALGAKLYEGYGMTERRPSRPRTGPDRTSTSRGASARSQRRWSSCASRIPPPAMRSRRARRGNFSGTGTPSRRGTTTVQRKTRKRSSIAREECGSDREMSATWTRTATSSSTIGSTT
jgi:long-chain acyl-CoA synthetase